MSRGDSATPLGKVRGLGPAGGAGHHWVEEKFVTVALTLLSLWLIFSLAMLPDLGQRTVVEWLRQPLAGAPMALFVIAAFKHGMDGLKVPIDDYVHDEGNRIGWHYAVKLAGTFGLALALFALARLLFAGAAQ